MRPTTTTSLAIVLAMAALGCKDEPSELPEAGDATTEGSTDDDTERTSHGTTECPTTSGASTGSADAADTADSDSVGEPPDDALPYEQTFEGPDGSPWPEPWYEAGDQVISSELVNGRGRFDGNTVNVARMVLPGFSETDVEAVITLEFEEFTQQGFGLYVRQNGGALLQTDPPGQGYAAYVEGGYMRFLGIWRETNGVEEPLANETVPGGELLPGPHRLRFQCFSVEDGTRLRARIWPLGEPEPATWLVDIVDDTPVLQGTAGSFALDVYNYAGMGSVWVDDLRIEAL